MTRTMWEHQGRGTVMFSVSSCFEIGRELTNGEARNGGRIHAAEAQW